MRCLLTLFLLFLSQKEKRKIRVDVVASLRFVGLLLRKEEGIEGVFSLLREA